MLSIGAFNALLKTLEEPPSYVIFIFATTELHKIPSTIISRCQKYELKRIKQNDITDLMAEICDKSDYTYDQVALEQIARLADGAARDSLSILEQCFAANAKKHISLDVLTDVLGLVTDEKIYEIVEAIHLQNGKVLLTHINDVVSNGKDLKRFTNQLLDYIRSLMLAKISSDLSTMINASDETIERINQQAEDISLNLLLRSIDILTKVEVDSKWSSNARIILEMGLIKMIQPDLENSLEAITQRVDALERRPVSRPVQQVVEMPQPEVKKSTPVVQEVVNQQEVETTVSAPTEASEEVVETVPEVVYETAVAREEDELEDLWEDVIAFVRNERVSTQVLLSDGHFEGIIDNCVTVSYGDGYGFHLIAIEKPENREVVERAIAQVFGQSLRVKYISKNQEEKKVESVESDDEKLYNFLGEHKNKLEFQD